MAVGAAVAEVELARLLAECRRLYIQISAPAAVGCQFYARASHTCAATGPQRTTNRFVGGTIYVGDGLSTVETVCALSANRTI